MSSQKHSFLVQAMWGLGGLTLGASLALLVLKNWTPDWVGATGTWFGAVATVLTLLWAVRSFRSDQAERELTRIAEHEREAEALMQRARGEFIEASNVSIALRGGAGHGSDPNMMMTSIQVRIQNHSKHDAVIKLFTFDELLKSRRELPTGVHILAGTTFSETYEIIAVPAKQDELSEGAVSRFSANMSYRLDGRDWRRSSDDSPVARANS
ncbi:hypothetical protein KRR55_19475 [Paeniglutamicibacter sp. ABSL32-1]|uniref:hypothetical protein n=1 Tax=Paeniglutamicibacter quisquiliarum TaxID=2849498 RepID=UPI001C2DA535|nr:hypothetical protein [Paeniglutamicibacter quisquiliarum]MBV1781295.1 hypothetical protein [Paeniglutamicibacter quisquiliarum]